MACLMQISNPVISSDLLVQSLGKHSFGVQLPQNIEGLFKIGLLSVAGRQPPQVQWALNAKSSALQRKQLKERDETSKETKRNKQKQTRIIVRREPTRSIPDGTRAGMAASGPNKADLRYPP